MIPYSICTTVSTFLPQKKPESFVNSRKVQRAHYFIFTFSVLYTFVCFWRFVSFDNSARWIFVDVFLHIPFLLYFAIKKNNTNLFVPTYFTNSTRNEDHEKDTSKWACCIVDKSYMEIICNKKNGKSKARNMDNNCHIPDSVH